jgi:hypothetical protein
MMLSKLKLHYNALAESQCITSIIEVNATRESGLPTAARNIEYAVFTLVAGYSTYTRSHMTRHNALLLALHWAPMYINVNHVTACSTRVPMIPPAVLSLSQRSWMDGAPLALCNYG